MITPSGRAKKPESDQNRLTSIFFYLFMAAATSLAALWLWLQPELLASDDALFFSRGINRYSVLEFSPHFPGYPAFIWLSKILNPLFDTSVECLLFVSRCSALLLPWLSYALLRKVGVKESISVFCFALCLSDPLLLGLGLQGLSEAPALCWLALACLALLHNKGVTAGLLLGLCLSTRPSYLPMLLPLVLWLSYQDLKRSKSLIAGLGVIAILSLTFILIQDGLGYFQEATRFIEGHFSQWGNSTLSNLQRDHWGVTAYRYFGALPVALFFTVAILLIIAQRHQAHGFSPERYALKVLSILFVSAFFWTIIAQNPENLRHLTPLLWLFYCGFCLLMSRLTNLKQSIISSILAVAQCAVLIANFGWLPMAPPIYQAVTWFKDKNSEAIASNWGIELLRQQLPNNIIADSYYPGNAARVLKQGGYQLSSTPIIDKEIQLLARFKSRSAIEKELWLYQNKDANKALPLE